jgi:hypothetical protein
MPAISPAVLVTSRSTIAKAMNGPKARRILKIALPGSGMQTVAFAIGRRRGIFTIAWNVH